MTPTIGSLESHGSRRLPWHTFMLLLLAFGLFVLGSPAAEGLVFDRQAIMQGELWRFLTAHWVHADWEHLGWNLVAFGILGWMIEISLGPTRLYSALIAGMCLVDAWVWLFVPGLDLYCGLSGILNTLLFVILIDGWRRSRKFIFPLVFVGATSKIAVELFQASAIFTNTSWPAVPEAHLAGALAAVILMYYKVMVNIGLKTCQCIKYKWDKRIKKTANAFILKTTRINSSNEII